MKKTLLIAGLAAMLAAACTPKAGLTASGLDPGNFEGERDGVSLGLYTLTNSSGMEVCITNFGGRIVSMMVPDRDGNLRDVVLGFDKVSDYFPENNQTDFGASIGRYANRIKDGRIVIDGVQYQLPQNNFGHCLHGGPTGWQYQPYEVLEHTGNRLRLLRHSPDGDNGFPGAVDATVEFLLDEDDMLHIDYEATTDAPTVINMTNHSYFNLNGAGNGDILGHQLQVLADNTTEADRDLIPTGKLTPVEGTPYDFRKPVTLSDRQVAVQGFGFGFGQRGEIPEGKVRQYDTNFCLNHTDPKKVEKVAEVYAPESGRVMEVWNNHPGMQVYTGGRTALALESQMYPDTPNHPEFPSARLDPGQKYQHTCIYKFSVR